MSEIAGVLLVDDDEVANFVHKSFLKKENITKQITVVMNGQEAIEEIRASNPHVNDKPTLILLDINMPVMNGHEFLDAFRQIEHSKKQFYKIVILSSSDNVRDIEMAQAKGATAYLNKPLEVEKVRNVISSYF